MVERILGDMVKCAAQFIEEKKFMGAIRLRSGEWSATFRVTPHSHRPCSCSLSSLFPHFGSTSPSDPRVRTHNTTHHNILGAKLGANFSGHKYNPAACDNAHLCPRPSSRTIGASFSEHEKVCSSLSQPRKLWDIKRAFIGIATNALLTRCVVRSMNCDECISSCGGT